MAKKKEVAKKEEVNWFKSHWIWTTFIVIIVILFILFIIGSANHVNNDVNTTSIIETIPAVQQFLSQNQNVEMKTVSLNQSTDNEKLE